ncbi:hypothetical protein M8J75_012333 [Diaphorina citri]|nr:hypothetical protein M8J75_012333 [Diaphorina citri]
MQLRICVFLCSIQLLVQDISCTIGDKAKDKSKAVTQKPTLSTQTVKIQSSAAPKEDIYIDDDTNIQAEGSGVSDFKDDLESSGSGFGPDDEDGDGPLIKKGNTKTRVLLIDENATPIPPSKSDSVEPDIITEHKSTDLESSPERDHGGSSNVDSVPPEHSSPGSEAGSGGSGNQDVFVVGGTDDRATSFFAQPGILAAVIGGAVVGLLCAILVVMFIVYRMRKKDEGSYALEEPKRSPASNSYMKNSNREFYA